MADFMYGADADQLDGLASSLDAAANELSDLLRQSAGEVALATLSTTLMSIWRGPRASDFGNIWQARHLYQLNGLEQMLRDAAQTARSNAAEQRVTSSSPSPGGAALIAAASGIALSAQILITGLPESPSDVAKWWDALSAQEQKSVIQNAPKQIGNTDGIPPEARYEANRNLVQIELDRLTSEGNTDDRIKLYQGIIDDPERNVLLFNPRGDGLIAEVIGDLATSSNVAVIVPGVSTDMNSYDPADAKTLSDASPDTATIMWLGYDTPSGIQLKALIDPSGALTNRAQEWAPTLASFTDGLKLHAPGEITVVAHSYGTVLSTEAAKVGMTVDRVILLGSPGVVAEDSSVFNGAEVYAGSNPGDPIPLSGLGRHDPTAATFHAKPLPGNPNPVTKWDRATAGLTQKLDLSAHSTYLDPDSESLDGIVTALGSRITRPDGMTTTRIVDPEGNVIQRTTARF